MPIGATKLTLFAKPALVATVDPGVAFAASLGSNINNRYPSVISANDYVMAGFTTAANLNNVETANFDFDGNLNWKKTFSYTGLNANHKEIATNGSDFWISAASSNTFYFARVDNTGSVSWKKQISKGANDNNYTNQDIAIDSSDNSYYVLAEDGVMSVDSSGNNNWDVKFQIGTTAITVESLAVSDNALYVLGTGPTSTSDTQDAIYIIKLNKTNGSIVSSKRYKAYYNNGIVQSYATAITLDSNDNVYFGVRTQQNTHTEIVKLNSSLNIQWAKVINLNTTEVNTAFAFDNDLDSLYTVHSYKVNGTYTETLISQIASNGTLTTQKRLRDTNNYVSPGDLAIGAEHLNIAVRTYEASLSGGSIKLFRVASDMTTTTGTYQGVSYFNESESLSNDTQYSFASATPSTSNPGFTVSTSSYPTVSTSSISTSVTTI